MMKAMIAADRGPAPARARRRSTSPTSPPGFYDGFWEVGLNPWDVAAGSLLIARGRRPDRRPRRRRRLSARRPGDRRQSADIRPDGQGAGAVPGVARSRSRQESLTFRPARRPDRCRAHCCFQAPNPDKGRIWRAICMTIPMSLCTMRRTGNARRVGGSRCGKHPGLGATDGSTMAARPCAAGPVGGRSPRLRRPRRSRASA